MPIIHIAELARLMLDYLEPAEAFVLGLMLGDTFPKMAVYADSIPAEKKRDMDAEGETFVSLCYSAAARAGWAGAPTALRNYYYLGHRHSRSVNLHCMCLALQLGHVSVFEELHAINTKGDNHLSTRPIAYFDFEIERLVRAAVAGGTASALVKSLGADRTLVSSMLAGAVKAGCLAMLEQVLDTSLVERDDLSKACRCAIWNGHLELVRCFVRRCDWLDLTHLHKKAGSCSNYYIREYLEARLLNTL